MAHEIFLAPIWEGEAPELQVARLHDVVRSVVADVDEQWQVDEPAEGGFEIEFPDGEASVLPTHVAFRLYGISAPLARLIHALAAAADVAIVNEGGGPTSSSLSSGISTDCPRS